MKVENLDRDQLIDLINSYDRYIQEANDEDKYKDGWLPVCVDEYVDNEFAEEMGWDE